MFVQDIVNTAKWEEFLTYKISKDFVPKKEKALFTDFITHQKYLTICQKIASGSYSFSVPQRVVSDTPA